MARLTTGQSVISMRLYQDGVSEGSPVWDMLSVGACRNGAGFPRKQCPDVVAAVKRTNFIISIEIIYYVVFAVDSSHIIYFSVSTAGGSFFVSVVLSKFHVLVFFLLFQMLFSFPKFRIGFESEIIIVVMIACLLFSCLS